MKLPRFRLRTLLILVMLAGIAEQENAALHMRSVEYGRLAARAEFNENSYDNMAKLDEEFAGMRIDAGSSEERSEFDRGRRKAAREAVDFRARRDYHASLKLKYRRAASHPWLPVAPDPPEPEWRDNLWSNQ